MRVADATLNQGMELTIEEYIIGASALDTLKHPSLGPMSSLPQRDSPCVKANKLCGQINLDPTMIELVDLVQSIGNDNIEGRLYI